MTEVILFSRIGISTPMDKISSAGTVSTSRERGLNLRSDADRDMEPRLGNPIELIM